MKKTKDEIVDIVLGWLKEAPEVDQQIFKNCTIEKLVAYHNNVGRQIRNDFGMWRETWTPIIGDDGCDCSPEHPDARSMEILKEVWRKVNEKN